MRYIFFVFLIVLRFSCFAQDEVSIVSWNLKDMGKSKNEYEIDFIANTVKGFDLLAIQEVVAGVDGPKAIARLVDALNRKGAQWDYVVSTVTSGSSEYKIERYAFIWKKGRISKIGRPWLEQQYGLLIEREPFYCRFRAGTKVFTLVNFHAVPKIKQPEREVKYFKFLPLLYIEEDLIFCGDFNLPESHSVFGPLKRMGYISALKKQKTSLKQKCIDNNCLASEYDNFYYQASAVKIKSAGVIHFYKAFEDLGDARKISDHVPIVLVY